MTPRSLFPLSGALLGPLAVGDPDARDDAEAGAYRVEPGGHLWRTAS